MFLCVFCKIHVKSGVQSRGGLAGREQMRHFSCSAGDRFAYLARALEVAHKCTGVLLSGGCLLCSLAQRWRLLFPKWNCYLRAAQWHHFYTGD